MALKQLFKIFLTLLALALIACNSPQGGADLLPSPPIAPLPANAVITIGDIDPDSPAKKIDRFSPLADYLAEELRQFGVREGRVVIAKDIAQMAQFMEEGTVDIYLDSTFPTLKVQELAGTRIIARRWKNDVPTY